MYLQERINHRLKLEHTKRSSELVAWIENKPIYAIGQNSETLKLSKSFKIDGIIDDFSELTSWRDISLFKSEKIDRNALLINCSTSISPVTVKKNLIQKGFSFATDYYELTEPPFNLPLPDFSIDTKLDFEKNPKKWSKIYDCLFDEESKKTFEDVLLFRLTSNPKFMNNYSVRIQNQYLEDFMEYSGEVMVDAGAFDGDTTELFCQKHPDYEAIHIFEPSILNINKAKKRLKNHNRILYYELGLSDSKGELLFEDDLGSSSRVSQIGEHSICINTLDNVIKEKISFIKMDIEGWEIPAILGSMTHVIKDHPKIAIAVYHKAEDFWKIPDLILNSGNDYEIYIRHYTEGWSETVMYFKPIK